MPVTLSRTVLTCGALLAFLSVSSVQAAVLPDAATLQTQLQGEWTRFTQALGADAAATGKVTVVQDGASYKATLPAMVVRLADQSQFRFAPLVVQATPDGSGALNLALTVPTSIPQYSGEKQIGSITLGEQNIKATVQPTNGVWQVQSLDGVLKNIQWKNTIQSTSASVGQIVLTGKPDQIQIRSQTIAVVNPVNVTTSVDSLALNQKAMTGKTMRLSDIFSMLTLITPQNTKAQGLLETWMGSAANGEILVKNLKTANSDTKSSMTIADATMQTMVTDIVGKTMTMKILGNFKGIQVSAAPAFASLIPQQADFVGTMRNLPADYFTLPLNTPEGQDKARAALAAAKTQLQIDSFKATTASGVEADATGLLTANTLPPNYMDGTVLLNLINLPEALAKIQQQMRSGTTSNGPVMMAMMLLQGMGKASPTNPNQTQYNVVFSPTGEILVNGQNLSALRNMTNMGSKAAPAAMPAPVTRPTAPIAPGLTPWKP
jgi:hypothetical protein